MALAGRYSEADGALQKIEDLAVGRVDRARLAKDVTARSSLVEAMAGGHVVINVMVDICGWMID